MTAQGRAERRSRVAPPWVGIPPESTSPERALHPRYARHVTVIGQESGPSRLQHETSPPWLPDDVRDSLFAYQAGIFKQWESPAS